MKLTSLAIGSLLLMAAPSVSLQASPDQNAPMTASGNGAAVLKYKMLTGFKQAFNDDLQLHLSKGWTPVGGVAVTVWNGDLYYAQLISRPAAQ